MSTPYAWLRLRLRGALCAALSCSPVAAAHAQETTPPPAADESEAARLSARIEVGAGVSMRELAIPSFEGTRDLSSGLAPAGQLSLAGRWGTDRSHIQLLMTYQSTLRARTRDQIGDQTLIPSEATIRSHRFEAGLQPGLALTHASRPAELGLLLGYAVRGFGSVETLRIPRFSLHGPLLRAELRLPLSSWLTLSVAPEAQLVVSVSRDLRELAGLPRSTLAWGGEAALQVDISDPWTLELRFREAHIRAPASEGRLWQDIERYILLGLVYRVE